MDAVTVVEPDAHQAEVVVSPRRVAPLSGAVERAYVVHGRAVYRYVLAITGSWPDAEDVTSEVFERALRSWRTEPDRAEAWLLATARHITMDRWRRVRRLPSLLSRLGGDRRADANEERTEFWAWFDAVSRVLTRQQREVLVLRYQRDLADADIAIILGLSESGVRSLVARALDSLRAHPELLR